MIEFLKSNLIGLLGWTLAWALGYFFYHRSRVSGIVAVNSHDLAMIGGRAVFPEEVELRYRKRRVPQITRSIVWIWNAGQKTVRASDIAPHDPLRLGFDGEVLDCRARRLSREVIRVRANLQDEAQDEVGIRFEFLDPRDGAVFEVLHTGSDGAPRCLGTIVGDAKSPRYWGPPGGVQTSSDWKAAAEHLFLRTMLFLMSLGGVGIVFVAIRAFLDSGSAGGDDSGLTWWGFSIVLAMGLLFTIGYGHMWWTNRRRFPSSLLLDSKASNYNEPPRSQRQKKR